MHRYEEKSNASYLVFFGLGSYGQQKASTVVLSGNSIGAALRATNEYCSTDEKATTEQLEQLEAELASKVTREGEYIFFTWPVGASHERCDLYVKHL